MSIFKNLRTLRVGVPTAAMAAMATGGVLYTVHPSAADTAGTPPAAAPAPASPASLHELSDLSTAFASVAAKVKPSVVYITAKETVKATNAGPMLQIPPEFRQFFNIPEMQAPQARPRTAMASGSGFIISPDGYILTNQHVVDGASQVTVRLLDHREFKAKVVGGDPMTDVAVLKIDAKNLPAAPLGNSDAAQVGEWVLAVGNPLGENLTFTVTEGIISAKGRALDLPNRNERSIQDFIQTDAVINPGNSGGPLVNVQGQVIGINAAIESPTGTYAGYGFAVPINLAHEVANKIIAKGHVDRAALGVTVRDATSEDAAYVGLSDVRGAVVQDFGSADSPAKHAGIQPGDVIIAVDGKPVEYTAQLQEMIAFRNPGDVVAVEVARKGGVHETLKVKLQSVSGDEAQSASNDTPDASGSAEGASVKALGLTVQPVDDATARQLQLPADDRGLIVTGVKDGGPASGHVATPGAGGPDILLSVEGTAVHSASQLRDALSHAGTNGVVSLQLYNVPAHQRRIERIRVQ